MADNNFHPDSLDSTISRLNTIAERMEQRLDKGDVKLDDLDKRVRKLELWRYYILGIAAALAAFGRAAWDWFIGNGPNISGKH